MQQHDELPVHQYTGLTAIGWTSRGPVWPVQGGAEDADPGDTGDGGDDTGDGDGDETGEGEGDGETVDWKAKHAEATAALEAERAQLAATQAKLARANKQAQKLREAATPPSKPVPAKATPRPAAAPDEDDTEPTTSRYDDAEVARLQTAAVKAYAKVALITAGCDPELVDAPLSRLRANKISWDDDEPSADDLDDFVEDMKEKYAKAFARPEPAPTKSAVPRRGGNIDQGAGSAGNPARKTQSFAEQLIAASGGDPRRRR